MKYKASDIITKARQIADLTNSEFLSWNEEVSMLNDAYTMLYQKLVNINDGSFVKPMELHTGANPLPPDFWQLRSVFIDRNGNIDLIKRRAASESMNVLSYEIKVDQLIIYGNPPMGKLVAEYWACPTTLTFKPKPVTLEPDLDERTAIAVHDEKFFSTASSKLYWYDCKTETESFVNLGANASLVVPCDEQALVITGSNNEKIVTYDGTVTALSGTPFITEGGAIGSITSNVGRINNHKVFEWDYETTGITLIVCDDDLTDFYYLKNGTIYHNGEQVLINDEAVNATVLYYVNHNCWYYNSNEVGFVDEGDNLHIVTIRPGVVGINKIDCNTGYGYTIGTTVYPWVEDTVLDFPNSMYFQIMAYMLAVQFKIKQGADAQGLLTVLSTLENTFYDTLTQDANDFVRIKNVY